MTTIEEEDEPQNIWTAIARSITEAAENTIRRKRKKPKKDQWISDETIFLIGKKRKLKALQNNSAELRKEFKMIKRQVQREVNQSINQRKICRATLYDTSRSANSSQW